MGNTMARNRLKAQDFHYIAKNTAFLTNDVVSDYYKDVIEKSSLGKMDPEEFKKIFRLAFPERPEEKLNALIEKIRNVEKTDGSIPIHTIAMLIYLFCDGKTEDNLGQVREAFITKKWPETHFKTVKTHEFSGMCPTGRDPGQLSPFISFEGVPKSRLIFFYIFFLS